MGCRIRIDTSETRFGKAISPVDCRRGLSVCIPDRSGLGWVEHWLLGGMPAMGDFRFVLGSY